MTVPEAAEIIGNMAEANVPEAIINDPFTAGFRASEARLYCRNPSVVAPEVRAKVEEAVYTLMHHHGRVR